MPLAEDLLQDWYRDGLQLRYLRPLHRKERQRPVPFYTLVALWSGDLRLRCYKYDLALAPGQAALLPPGHPITTRRSSGGTDAADAFLCGFMPASDRMGADPLARLPLPAAVDMDDPAHWQAQVRLLLASWQRDSQPDLRERLRLRPLVDDLVTRFLVAGSDVGVLDVQAERPVPEWLQAAVVLLRRQAMRRDFTLPQLARQLGLSLSSLQHAFHAHFGEPPGAVLRRQRLQLAAEMLRSNPERSIAEVAQASGFVSAGALGACFRRAYDVSPKRFRAGDRAARST